ALDPDARPASAAAVGAADRLERVDPVGARVLAEAEEDHARTVRHAGIIAHGGRSLGRGIGVRSISADSSGESLDGSATPLRRSFLGESGDGGLAAGAPGNRRGGMSMT